LKRKAIVISIIIILLLGAFFVFYILKRQTIDNYNKYPPTTDCNSIIKMFNGNLTSDDFKTAATFDKESTLNKYGTGVY